MKDEEIWELFHRHGGVTPQAVAEFMKKLAKEWWGIEVQVLGRDLTNEQLGRLGSFVDKKVKQYEADREKE